MVEEAALGATTEASFCRCQEEVPGMVEQLTNSPLTTMLPCLGNLLLPVENIQAPMLLRSEESNWLDRS
jgi:hypothetical protein